ncbi:TIR domain-containing protein [Candidatus Collierbacteria bacterium]|nr:TIR domain-containing protein [Candidatus Collierbacteria bacterium]
MSYKNKTYVAFDGDTDMWAYRLMTAWKSNENMDFNFYNAHDLNSARDTSTEESIKSQLRERMANAKQMVLLVGEKTKNLRKFVPWEIELARKKDVSIIVVNLNGDREYDSTLCPSAVGTEVYTMHVSFNAKIIQYALDNFPSRYQDHKNEFPGNYFYKETVYKELGL